MLSFISKPFGTTDERRWTQIKALIKTHISIQ